jgi:hypothetical protein
MGAAQKNMAKARVVNDLLIRQLKQTGMELIVLEVL